MPTQARVGLHHEDGPAVTAEHGRERGKDGAVVGFEARTHDLALQHRELMAQHEDLDVLGTVRAAAQHQQVEHEPDKTVETGRAPIFAALRSRRSGGAKTPGQTCRTSSRHAQDAARTCGCPVVVAAAAEGEVLEPTPFVLDQLPKPAQPAAKH